jgi:5-methylcytosine-specific restriction protein A
MIDNMFDRFLTNWPDEKASLNQTMESNKLWNAEYRILNNLGTKDKAYKNNKKTLQVSKNNTASLVLKDIPGTILKKSSLLDTEYKIEGSVGKGNISEIPWICIFDRDITESAESGFYLVYLLRADLSGFYLSLNQGWTQYEKAFKPKSIAKIVIEKNARKLKKSLKTLVGFSFNKIDLKGDSDLAKGYELGNICSVYYDHNSLPNSDILISDLQKLIGSYRELKSLVGNNILDIDLVLDEEEFQARAQSGKVRTPKKGKVSKKKKVNGATSSTWWRDPDMGFTAISNANFKCENDPKHETFISPVTSKQFVEAHHLLPMEFQDDFEASIDVPENIISLCPNCHRAFHNSIDKTKAELISKFFRQRKDFLKGRDINLTENKLLECYKTTPYNDCNDQ